MTTDHVTRWASYPQGRPTVNDAIHACNAHRGNPDDADLRDAFIEVVDYLDVTDFVILPEEVYAAYAAIA